MGSATVSGCLPISVYDGSQSLPIAGTDPDELQARSTIRCGRFARNGRASVAGERVLEDPRTVENPP